MFRVNNYHHVDMQEMLLMPSPSIWRLLASNMIVRHGIKSQQDMVACLYNEVIQHLQHL